MTTGRSRPSWRPLTSELDDNNSAPRRLLGQAFPRLRDVQADYREAVGPILVPARDANAGTVGTAFDVWLQLQAAARPPLELAGRGAALAGAAAAESYRRLLDSLGGDARPSVPDVAGRWTGPSTQLDERDLLRLSWATACLVEVYRSGRVWRGSPLAEPPADGRTVDLLALAPPAALDELADLAELAHERLLPQLQALAASGPTWLGPAFAASAAMKADADLVTGHTLVELKTTLGRKTPTGRKATLDGLTIYQLLGYVLHDHDDGHQIRSVAVYQARYGHLAVWPLDRLLPELAGSEVNLSQLRRRWTEMLASGPV